MADIAVVLRRLRGLINDKPRGRSMSNTGFVTTLASQSVAKLNISMSGGTVKLATITSPTTLTTGKAIAAGLQAAIRAVASPTTEHTLATVEFDTSYGYIVRNGLVGSTTTVTITPYTTTPSENVAGVLKLGLLNSGTEDMDPAPRYTDDELTTFLNDGLNQWNGSNPTQPARTWTDIPEREITLVLYLAWRMVLESDIGSAVYTYRQTLGGDSLDLSTIFRNILDLLKYLADSYQKMKDSLGLPDIFVTDLFRFDRNRGLAVPDYVESRLQRPRILQLAKVTTTSLLVEWKEILTDDFTQVAIWTSPSASMVDRSLLTQSPIQNNNDQVGMKSTATSQKVIYDQHFTSATITGLTSAPTYVVIVVRDSRGYYHYSDEYVLDISGSSPAALSVSNEPLI